jgi:hypothetical protein
MAVVECKTSYHQVHTVSVAAREPLTATRERRLALPEIFLSWLLFFSTTTFLTLVRGVLGLPIPGFSRAAVGRLKAVSGVRGSGALPRAGVAGSFGGGRGAEMDDSSG